AGFRRCERAQPRAVVARCDAFLERSVELQRQAARTVQIVDSRERGRCRGGIGVQRPPERALDLHELAASLEELVQRCSEFVHRLIRTAGPKTTRPALRRAEYTMRFQATTPGVVRACSVATLRSEETYRKAQVAPVTRLTGAARARLA